MKIIILLLVIFALSALASSAAVGQSGGYVAPRAGGGYNAYGR